MRTDIARLARQRSLSGVLVLGGFRDNPNYQYATGGSQSDAFYLIPASGKPAVLHRDMERDNLPAVPGLRAVPFSKATASLKKRLEAGRAGKSAKLPTSVPMRDGALVAEFCRMVRFDGSLALSGKVEAGYALQFARSLEAESKGAVKLDLSTEASATVAAARATKDEGEVRLIQEAGRRTEQAIATVCEFIAAGTIRRGRVVDHRGRPVTIGQLRELMVATLRELGMDCPETPIISQGEEAAVPHNVGTDSRPLRAGSPLVLDIYPRLAGTNYFFDVTRTVCPGPASAELKKVYADVLLVQRATLAMVRAGVTCRAVHDEACRLFEERGHPTLRTKPGTNQGFCHSLGHGLGLDVHELPTLAASPVAELPLEPGHVITIEPGLYYPERGIGVRLEDVVAVMPNGRGKNLSRLPKRLELDLRAE